MQIADCRVQIAECRLQSADCRVQIAECRVQSADCRVQIAECRTGDMAALDAPSASHSSLFILHSALVTGATARDIRQDCRPGKKRLGAPGSAVLGGLVGPSC